MKKGGDREEETSVSSTQRQEGVCMAGSMGHYVSVAAARLGWKQCTEHTLWASAFTNHKIVEA